jgi:proton-dependent oligopeptide transporter, POT family
MTGAPQSTVVPRPWQLPAGARLVIGFEFAERVGFYSMVSLLALFLTAPRAAGGFSWQPAPALTLVGVFSGLMYALPVVGGWIADRALGHRRALAIGGSLLLTGYIVLTASTWIASTVLRSVEQPLGLWPTPAGVGPAYGWSRIAFWSALATLVIGNSLVKSTLVVVLGDSFLGDDGRRESAYAYYYAGINLGGLVAGFLAGSVAAAAGWTMAFSMSALAMGSALGAYFVHRHHLIDTGSRTSSRQMPAVPEADEHNVFVRLSILTAFAILLLVYAAGSFQLWGTMSLFLERSVDRHVGALEIPTQWFTSVESAALILAAPGFALLWAWLARKGREPDTLVKYVLALVLGAAGLFLFAATAAKAIPGVKPGWLVPAVGIAIQATGEVAAWTVTYGLVYRLAPRRIVAAIMGAFYALTLGLGAYLAGWLGTFAERLGYGRFFFLLGLGTLGFAVLALLSGPRLRAVAARHGAALEAASTIGARPNQ